MTQANYPTLGSKVTYIRQIKLGTTEKGSGTILGLGLDATKRITAHVELDTVAKEKVNIDIACLNPTDEFSEKFKTCVERVELLTEEGNKEVRGLVEYYNGMVEDLYSAMLGDAVVFEENNVKQDN